ncbi:MAG: hypothetical protein US50_C0019G0013 [Candidatus Nomurabacteria bacterium GW2011_GWB1_37_5]|uniref:Uncharacterized protein n=1 Tax=Candidatus Nomurabacteria bacterium GW2011_GWB1_37_5 TaxID=1618742 RepID=A0A0G0K3T3_9BACT|nr:MAG: hypothetical protein US50_C0019G0013 [Candidatus Nomurabacteria bacterium GW2011_GWB1_37_5]
MKKGITYFALLFSISSLVPINLSAQSDDPIEAEIFKRKNGIEAAIIYTGKDSALKSTLFLSDTRLKDKFVTTVFRIQTEDNLISEEQSVSTTDQKRINANAVEIKFPKKITVLSIDSVGEPFHPTYFRKGLMTSFVRITAK